jgi:hypothetical protein
MILTTKLLQNKKEKKNHCKKETVKKLERN